MYKFLALAATLACANAGLAPVASWASPAIASSWSLGQAAIAPAAITSQSQNILRSPLNLGQVSTYSKTIDTPWSSVTKSDIRVSNPGLATISSPLALGSPLLGARTIASPLALGSPAIASPLLGARTIASPVALGSPLLGARTLGAPLALGAPAIHGAALAAPVARAGLLGVAYSAAPAVAHVSLDTPLTHLAW